MARIVVGVTGASGVILAKRAVELLIANGHQVEVVISKAADYTPSLENVELPEATHKIHDIGASIASGSYQVDGMLLIPCSMATLAAIACGLSDNLIRRAADVTLKERRKLVIIPREAPFSEIHLENMLKITRMGGVILPPSPAWYLHQKSLQDVEEFIVGRAFDLLGLEANFSPRWGK